MNKGFVCTLYICGNVVLYLNAQIKQMYGLFLLLLLFVCLLIPVAYLPHSICTCLFVYNMEPSRTFEAGSAVTNRERAAAGTMPSCLGLSVCKGRAVCPHQCQHVAYMYTAAGGPVCVCTVCAYLCLLRPSPIACSRLCGCNDNAITLVTPICCDMLFYGQTNTHN